ncbi:MAG: DUF3592 domain-containing protein [Planctomycetota bacterium]
MSDLLPQSLDPPPRSDGRFSRTEDGFRIEFKVRDPRRLRLWLVAAMVPLILVAVAGVGFIRAAGFSQWWGYALAVLLGALGLAVFFVLIVVLITFCISGRVIYDGSALFFGNGPGNESTNGYCFPLDEIVGLRLYRTGQSVKSYCLAAPLTQIRATTEQARCEVVTPDGVIQVLNDWAIDEARWAMQVIASQSGLCILPDRTPEQDKPEIVLTSNSNLWSGKDKWKIALAASVCALLFAAMGFYSIWQVREAANWPQTTAALTRCEMGKDSDGDPVIKVKYRYRVDGRSYTGERYSLVGLGEREQQRFVDSHPIGTSITIYYDPTDPDRATIRRDHGSARPWGWFFCPGIVVIGLIVLFIIPIKPEQISLHQRYYLDSERKKKG